jgi:hypothetical protein
MMMPAAASANFTARTYRTVCATVGNGSDPVARGVSATGGGGAAQPQLTHVGEVAAVAVGDLHR